GRENELEQLSSHVLRPNLPQDGHRTAFPAPNQRPTPRNPIVQESPSACARRRAPPTASVTSRATSKRAPATLVFVASPRLSGRVRKISPPAAAVTPVRSRPASGVAARTARPPIAYQA